ncbi:ribonuclease H-like domain-containing protein [Clostridium swellfunianum]|uniref:ribonuclease H-like domain-containing protein n=1 Tax=Clostridium swellfunianum TaxID=1367462 RepID=UPI00202EC7A7|nr:ribonuclease H-like domain-containing protein [Clostridium swellfunianum]MCM0650664.1 ribonuclease H-like domain-containing protein [Clostridium swellfunianum]
MFIREYKDKIKVDRKVIDKYDMHNIAYFDIETTGFEKDKDHIILISLGYFNEEGLLTIKQYFAEELEDETDILHAFSSDLEKFSKWCSYNGIAFDEPFVVRRSEKNNIYFNIPSEHIDLYRMIRPYYRQLGMERCNLKTVEKFLGVEREDQIDGAISVEMYNQYLQTKDEELKDIIMLHNYEDVLNLPRIFTLIYKVQSSDTIVRDDCITEKQLRFLRSLIKKNKIELNVDVERISKKAASKVIDAILRGTKDETELTAIANNSY